MEAIYGACYLTAALRRPTASSFTLMEDQIRLVLEEDWASITRRDCRSNAEIAKDVPTYTLEDPPSTTTFYMEVDVAGQVFMAPGIGANKKEAQQQAAKAACEVLIRRSSAH